MLRQSAVLLSPSSEQELVLALQLAVCLLTLALACLRSFALAAKVKVG